MTVVCNNALTYLKTLETDSIDACITDPPYGYSFMNKDWDKAVISSDTWKEVLRVLKPGSFAAIMSSPRQDVLARMIVNLQTAGFRTDFTSIYWTYTSGFPKAANISKLVDKRNGRGSDEYKALGNYLKDSRLKLNISSKSITEVFPSKTGGLTGCLWNWENGENVPTLQQWNILKEKLDLDDRFDELIEREEAEREILGQRTDGRYKYAFRVNPHKFYTEQQKETSKKINDITEPATEKAKELDGSHAGFQPKPAVEVILIVMKPLSEKTYVNQALKNGKGITWLDNCRLNQKFPANLLVSDSVLKDHSKYFDLDKWFETTFPFIITPKASSTEKGEYNKHATVKPIKLMSWLITLLSREGDTILDPFCGSGTTLLAAKMLNRKYIGIDINQEYIDITKKRLL